MFNNLFKIWHETLYYINKNNAKDVQSDLDIEFIEINYNNTKWVKDLRGKEFLKQFNQQLSYGDFGYYAMYDNKPVAYGWIKHYRSSDYFFKIGKNSCYLCRFFTSNSFRGHNIYPMLINKLLNTENNISNIYIDIEQGNIASERGLKKIGFCKQKDLRFYRIFRITLNKYNLK